MNVQRSKPHNLLMTALEAEFYTLTRARWAAIDNASRGNPFKCPVAHLIEKQLNKHRQAIGEEAARLITILATQDFDDDTSRSVPSGQSQPGANDKGFST